MSLPNTYRQLEYLYNPAAAGSGVAYIETGVSGSSVVGYEIGIKVTTVSRSYARYFGGNDLPEYAVLCYNGSSTGSQQLVLHTASTSYNAFYCGNDWHTVKLRDDSTALSKLSLDGSTITLLSKQTYGNTSFKLFSTNWTAGSGASYISYAKLYSDDVLVRNYVPAQRKSDGELGMYDLVNDVFYTSATANKFVAGPQVNADVSKVVYNNEIVIDITDTTATPSDVAAGKVFYTADGKRVIGTA